MSRASRIRAVEPFVTRDRGAHSAVLTLEAIEALTGVGQNPTLREVARVRELTLPGVQHHVAILEKAKLLAPRKKGNARAFRVLDTTPEENDWLSVIQVTLDRSQTRSNQAILDAFAEAVNSAFYKVDLQGSQIELRIRHRP